MVDCCTIFCSADLEQFRTNYQCAYLKGDHVNVNEVLCLRITSNGLDRARARSVMHCCNVIARKLCRASLISKGYYWTVS